MRRLAALVLASLAAACGGDPTSTIDAGPADASRAIDAFSPDAEPEPGAQPPACATITWEEIGRNGYAPVLAIDNTGVPRTIYQDPGTGDVYFSSKNPSWTHELVADAGFDRNVSSFTARMVIDAYDVPHVVYQNLEEAPVYAWREPANGWQTQTLPADQGYVALALDPQSRPHVLWVDRATGDLHTAVRDLGAWTSELVAEAAESDEYAHYRSSLAIDTAGGIHVVYTDPDIAAHHAYKAPGGAWVDTVIATQETLGLDTHVAVAPDGGVHAFFASRVGFEDGLRLRHAHRATSGADWVISSVARTYSVNMDSAMSVVPAAGVYLSFPSERVPGIVEHELEYRPFDGAPVACTGTRTGVVPGGGVLHVIAGGVQNPLGLDGVLYGTFAPPQP